MNPLFIPTPTLPTPPFSSSRPKMAPLTPAQMIQPLPTHCSASSGQVRVRQHLNPLARRWSQPVHLPSDWYATAFSDPTLPLAVDIGVAKGRFLLQLAPENPHINYLGLEIREPLVHQANRCAADAALSNLFYIACNANVSLGGILRQTPARVLRQVYVQFCDPWFKKKHAKRRMVTPQLVNDIHHALRSANPNALYGTDAPFVFVQSDVLELAVEITALFDAHGGFRRVRQKDEMVEGQHQWLQTNPIGLPTEREIAVLKKGGSVYRAVYHLVDNSETTQQHLEVKAAQVAPRKAFNPQD